MTWKSLFFRKILFIKNYFSENHFPPNQTLLKLIRWHPHDDISRQLYESLAWVVVLIDRCNNCLLEIKEMKVGILSWSKRYDQKWLQFKHKKGVIDVLSKSRVISGGWYFSFEYVANSQHMHGRKHHFTGANIHKKKEK